MIHRIVKMKFKPEFSDEFSDFIPSMVNKIASFEGCSKVEILRDVKNENIFFTCSYWNSESDIENYKYSELFKDVWAKTKKMFAEKAQAWSTILVTKA